MNSFSFDSFNFKPASRGEKSESPYDRSFPVKDDSTEKKFELPNPKQGLDTAKQQLGVKKEVVTVKESLPKEVKESNLKDVVLSEEASTPTEVEITDATVGKNVLGIISYLKGGVENPEEVLLGGDQENANVGALLEVIQGLDEVDQGDGLLKDSQQDGDLLKFSKGSEGGMVKISSQVSVNLEGKSHEENVPKQVVQVQAKEVEAISLNEPLRQGLMGEGKEVVLSDEAKKTVNVKENVQTSTIQDLNRSDYIKGSNALKNEASAKGEITGSSEQSRDALLSVYGKNDPSGQKIIQRLNDKNIVQPLQQTDKLTESEYAKIERGDWDKNGINDKQLIDSKNIVEFSRNQKLQQASNAEYQSQYSLGASNNVKVNEAISSKLPESAYQGIEKEIQNIQKDLQRMRDFRQGHSDFSKEGVKGFSQEIASRSDYTKGYHRVGEDLSLPKIGIPLLKGSLEGAPVGGGNHAIQDVGNAGNQQIASAFNNQANLSKEREKKEKDDIQRLEKMDVANSDTGPKSATAQSISKVASTSLQSEVVPAIIQQIEKFQKLGNKQWTKISLSLSGGEKVNINVKVSGNKVSLRLDDTNTDVASVIRAHWKDIKSLASAKGMDIEYVNNSLEYKDMGAVLSQMA